LYEIQTLFFFFSFSPLFPYLNGWKQGGHAGEHSVSIQREGGVLATVLCDKPKVNYRDKPLFCEQYKQREREQLDRFFGIFLLLKVNGDFASSPSLKIK